MVVNAPSGSGKSNMIVNLIELFSKGEGTFSTIELFCRCKDEPLYQFLSDKTKGAIKIYEDLTELKNINTYDKTENHLGGVGMTWFLLKTSLKLVSFSCVIGNKAYH